MELSLFNSVTFQASSFDSIALAFAAVPRENKAAFVRQVYDWNSYAIAFALSEPEYRRVDDLDREIEHVVLSLLAEKRWDAVIPSAERSIDALSLFPAEKSQGLLAVSSPEQLLRDVNRIESESSWFREWKEVFCLPSDSEIADELVSRLSDEDSIIGWTLANVLKRVRLCTRQIELVSDFTRSDRLVVRWRAIHVLGGYPRERSKLEGFRLLDGDPDYWVKYGAIRSLVEIAARAGGKSN